MNLRSWLDARLFRYPFEGAGARRYSLLERCGFGDLDERLITRWHDDLARAGTLLDVGAGPGTFSTRVAASFPHLNVIALEPSRDLAGSAAGAHCLRARAEALPLASASIDVALCLSSIRHVGDRQRALGELYRVVAPGGVLYIVEVDPYATARQIRSHKSRIRSWPLRISFGPLVVKLAPAAEYFAALAQKSGWRLTDLDRDPIQPVYIMRLTR